MSSDKNAELQQVGQGKAIATRAKPTPGQLVDSAVERLVTKAEHQYSEILMFDAGLATQQQVLAWRVKLEAARDIFAAAQGLRGKTSAAATLVNAREAAFAEIQRRRLAANARTVVEVHAPLPEQHAYVERTVADQAPTRMATPSAEPPSSSDMLTGSRARVACTDDSVNKNVDDVARETYVIQESTRSLIDPELGKG